MWQFLSRKCLNFLLQLIPRNTGPYFFSSDVFYCSVLPHSFSVLLLALPQLCGTSYKTKKTLQGSGLCISMICIFSLLFLEILLEMMTRKNRNYFHIKRYMYINKTQDFCTIVSLKNSPIFKFCLAATLQKETRVGCYMCKGTSEYGQESIQRCSTL